MSGEFKDGLSKAFEAFSANPLKAPDTVKASSVSQLFPDKRDAQVGDLQETIQKGRKIDFQDSPEKSERVKKEHVGTLAKAASTVLQASEGTAYWKERAYKPSSESGDDTEASLNREQVAGKLLDAMISNGGNEIRYEMFDRAFSKDLESAYSSSVEGSMPAHQRRLFTKIAPLLYERMNDKLRASGEEAEDEKHKIQLAENQKFMVNKLKSVARGDLEARFVGKKEYSSFSHEAMQSLIKIGGGEWRDVVDDFLKDPDAKLSDKEDIVAYLPINNLVDYVSLSTALSKIDKEGKQFKKVLEAGLKNLSENSFRLGQLDGERVQLEHTTKLFKDFSPGEQEKILKNKRATAKGHLLSMNWGGDSKLAQKALETIFNSEEFFNSEEQSDLLFSWQEFAADGVTSASQTVIESLPEAMKSIVDEPVRLKLAQELFNKIYNVVDAHKKRPIKENLDRILYYLKTMQKVQRGFKLQDRPIANGNMIKDLVSEETNISRKQRKDIIASLDRIS